MKRILVVALAMLLLLTACSAGVSQAEYDALVAENEQLKQQLAQYEGSENVQTQNAPEAVEESSSQEITLSEPIAVDASPASESDFIYVNNGTEVQINGYKGNGGYIVMPSEIEGNPVTRIAQDAFRGADTITGIVLPESLNYIGDSAFMYLSGLTGVLVIPETVTEIGQHAFFATSLTGIVIKGSCEIGPDSFRSILPLEFIYIEESCAPSINFRAFADNPALTKAILPETMGEFKEDVFKGCNQLVICTPQSSSYVAGYANSNFIAVDTDSYAEQAKHFSEMYPAGE